MDTNSALEITDAIYAAALGEAEWADALAMLGDGLGCAGATVEFHDMDSGRLLDLHCIRIDPAAMEAYGRDYVTRNPRTRSLQIDCDVAFDHMFLTESEMDRHPFYADFLAPQDLRYFMSAQTPIIDARVKGIVALQRHGRVRGADMESVRTLRLFLPHISRALKLYWRRLRADLAPGDLDEALARHSLTEAERRLAIALAYGESPTAYAQRTSRSINTVYTHYRSIKQKLDCATQAELLARLHALGSGRAPP